MIIIKSISKIRLWGFLIICVGTIPLLMGIWFTPDNAIFPASTYNNSDTYQYLAWIEQAREGYWFFNNPFTTEQHGRVLFHPLFLLLGKIAYVTNLPNILIYQLCRIVAGIFLLWVIWRFICFSIDSDSDGLKLFAFILITSGCGLVWLKWLEPLFETDFYFLYSATFRAASSTFWSLYLYPLFSLSIALSLLCFLAFQRFLEKEKLKDSIIAGFYLLILISLHPYNLLIVAVVLAGQVSLLCIYNKRLIWSYWTGYMVCMTCSLPYVAYVFLIIHRDPVFWLVTSVPIYSPTIIELLFMFGFTLPIALLAIPSLMQAKTIKSTLLLVWLITIPILTNLPIRPINIPTRLIEGYPLLVSLISAIVLYKYINLISKEYLRRIVFLIVILFFSLGNIWVLVRDIEANQSATPWELKKLIPKDLDSALNWLHTKDKGNVMASYQVSKYVPAYTGNIVYAGHEFMTVNLDEKLKDIYAFYQEIVPDQLRFEFMNNNNIRYVILSPVESKFSTYDFKHSKLFDLIFANEEVNIFEFNK